MGTVSKIDKVLAALKAERAVLDHAIAKIEAEIAVKPAAKPRKPSIWSPADAGDLSRGVV